MKIGMILGGIALGGIAVMMGRVEAVAVPSPRDDGGVAAGYDVIVGAIPNVSKYGSVVVSGVTIMAYAFGSTSCNIGTIPLPWIANTPDHPIIPQNAYRLKNGRFDQVGMSWCKHGFCALQQNLCSACTPYGGGCPDHLGVGCSDPYDSGLNGDQSGLGPRSSVNAYSGVFTYPYSAPAAQAVIGRRLQVDKNDFDPAMNPASTFYAECMYVHPDDSASGNQDNNASYRQFTVGAFSAGAYVLTLTGSTIQQKPAIFAWKSAQPTVTIQKVTVPGDGSFYVAYDAKQNGNGTWHWEVAILNMNCDRSGASLSIPVPAGVCITNVGYHDIAAHSGEPYNSIDWTNTLSGGFLTWSCTETWGANSNANALRWSTLYNFWFDSSTGPTTINNASLGIFKPGSPTSMNFTMTGPSAAPLPGDFNCDGHVDGADLGILIGAWGTPAGDLNGDGTTDGADLGILIAHWG